MKAPKPLKSKKKWAYFSPDGYIQVRSIADTKALSREMICKHESLLYRHYEEKGYTLHKVSVKIEVL